MKISMLLDNLKKKRILIEKLVIFTLTEQNVITLITKKWLQNFMFCKIYVFEFLDSICGHIQKKC